MITLHKIIKYLSDDTINSSSFNKNISHRDINSDNFHMENDIKRKSNDIFTMLETTIIDFSILAMYDYQQQNMFPNKFREIIPVGSYRFGIKNLHQTNMSMAISNISFINTVNILLKPELKGVNADTQFHYYNLMKEFICNKISANYQIEKKRNNKKTQDKNNQMVLEIKSGITTPDIIQYVCNLFEFNLCVCYLNDNKIDYYYSFPESFTYVNLFKPLFFMSCINDNYEPIIQTYSNIQLQSQTQSSEHNSMIHDYGLSNINCLLHKDIINPLYPLRLHPLFLEYITFLDIPLKDYIKICELYFQNDDN
jgi:hypothetical protein